MVSAALIAIALLTGCRRAASDPRIGRAERLAEDFPREALAALDSIDPGSLDGYDRYLHDFLSVKASDKAYITHTSDSLILRVIGYTDSHNVGKTQRAEALYYGGRVYSDLGDFPQALKYYQAAIDLLPATDTPSLRLRGNLLSQTGRLLNSLRIYEDAIAYVTEALRIDSVLNDSLNIPYDILLLGGINLRAQKLDEAKEWFSKVTEGECSDRARMYLAETENRSGNIARALELIRPLPGRMDSLAENNALAYAATIYLKAGIPDTALIYALRLARSPFNHNREAAYQLLLSEELVSHIDPDSLTLYVRDYRRLLEKKFDDNDNLLALNQQAFYNYELHDRRRLQAERRRAQSMVWLIGVVCALSLTIGVALWLKVRNQRTRLLLREALDTIGRLSTVSPAAAPMPDEPAVPTEQLRDRLRQQLINLYESSSDQTEVSPAIISSEGYAKLQRSISLGRNIENDHNLWAEIEKGVKASSPEFESNLRLLTLGRLTTNEYHTALLIKCLSLIHI